MSCSGVTLRSDIVSMQPFHRDSFSRGEGRDPYVYLQKCANQCVETKNHLRDLVKATVPISLGTGHLSDQVHDWPKSYEKIHLSK